MTKYPRTKKTENQNLQSVGTKSEMNYNNYGKRFDCMHEIYVLQHLTIQIIPSDYLLRES